ncbi:MAG: metal-dependent hydrolase [DPANN group archaeon]|nr:metal-dependent hydrolase [DPANN group archaeon]
MPNYKTHLLFGFLFFIALYAIFPIANKGILFLSALCLFIGSLFPDIDHKNSKAFKTLRDLIIILFSIYIIVSLVNDVPLMLFMLFVWFLSADKIILFLKPKHRGITHTFTSSIIFLIVLSAIAFILNRNISPGLFGFVGYLSHIIIDKIKI